MPASHDGVMGNAELHSIHVHPVKAFRALSPREAVVEPWGRRVTLGLVDDGGKVVTQRRQPRLALAAAELLPGAAAAYACPRPAVSR